MSHTVSMIDLSRSLVQNLRAFYMDQFNGMPEIVGAEPEMVLIAEFNSIIFTIPSNIFKEMIIFMSFHVV